MALLHSLENLRLALQVENFHILTGRQANRCNMMRAVKSAVEPGTVTAMVLPLRSARI